MDYRLVLIAAFGLLAFAFRQALAATEQQPAGDAPVTNDLLTEITSQAENLMTDPAAAAADPNVAAFLAMIRTGEGTADPFGYSRLFGGGMFSGFADHPRISVTRGSLTSTAAGAYQILARTWDDLRASYADLLPDFSPVSQDTAAVLLIRRRGALADVIAGRFDAAIGKVNREWASMPGSPYGQPTLSMDAARSVIVTQGGTFA